MNAFLALPCKYRVNWIQIMQQGSLSILVLMLSSCVVYDNSGTWPYSRMSVWNTSHHSKRLPVLVMSLLQCCFSLMLGLVV